MTIIETKDVFNLIHKQTKTISSLLIDHNDKALHDSKKLFESFRSKFAAQATELEQNTQWNSFAIAFYGETNSGKSTPIEALIIRFQEPSKLEQQD